MMPSILTKSLVVLTAAAIIAIAVSSQVHAQALEVFGTAVLILEAAVLCAYTLRRDPAIPDSDELQQYVRWTRDFLLLFVVMGAFSILAFCLQQLYPDQRPRYFFGSLGAGLLLGLASLAIGGVLGFIFGVPRALREKSDENAKSVSLGATGAGLDSSAQIQHTSRQTTRVNTNLEEISDWLTKIIVGVGLTQLMNMPRYIQDFASFVTPSCGPNCVFFGPAIAFAIFAFFSCCGFLLAYLLTRLFLQRPFAIAGEIQGKIAAVLRAAEIDAEGKTGAIDPVESAQSQSPVSELELDRARNLQRLSIGTGALTEQIDRLAADYESRRATMSSGFERTSAMEQIAAQMKALGLSIPKDLLGALSESDSPGHRLAAVMALQIAPRREFIKWLGDRIASERPFIGYQASRSLRSAARALDRDSLPTLEQTIAAAMQALPEDSDRFKELKAALEDVQNSKS